jgi:anti-anti-sigma factor
VSELAAVAISEQDGIVVASVSGEVDISNAGDTLSQVAGAVPNDAHGLVVDFTELEFMDSSGVHMLYELAERLANRQQRFAVILPSDRPPRRAIELSGVEPASWLHEDEASAMAAVRGGA